MMEGAARGMEDHDTQPVPSTDGMETIRIQQGNMDKPLRFNVLPEFLQLAQVAAENPNPSKWTHHGWVIESKRGSAEVKFAPSARSGMRLILTPREEK